MKSLILAFSFLAVVFANADTQIVYSTKKTEIKGSAIFPGNVAISMDKVCVSSDKSTLAAFIAEHSVKKCVESTIDRSDSTHPKTVCLKYEVSSIPNQILTRPVTISKNECINWNYDYSDSTRPVKTCLQYGVVQEAQPLSYEIVSYDLWDYNRQDPQSTRVTVPTCQ